MSTGPEGPPPSFYSPESAPEDLLNWSDPAAWDGEVPGQGDVALISRPVMLDVDGRVAGVIIEEGGSLSFDPASTRTLESSGNIVVRGQLIMRPLNATVIHNLRFVHVDESRFMGAGMTAMDSDVGLWVVPGGLLDLWGTTKLPWSRLTDGLDAGNRVLPLLQDPHGWEIGDELVIVPNSAPGTEGHQVFEEHRIESINGSTIHLDRPLEYAHPAVDVGRGRVLTAEVLNLTRNVILSGTPEGRSHTIILGHHGSTSGNPAVLPQQAGYFRLEHMGPYNSRAQPVHFSEAVEASQPLDGRTREPLEIPVLARWPFHFHHAGEGSRGSVIEGAVAYRPSSHAFVAHESHGVTFDACIAYDAVTSPFWWDGDGLAPDPSRSRVRPPDHTIDGHYRNCVAAKVRMFEGIENLAFEPVWAAGWGPADVLRPDQLQWPGYSASRLGGFTLVKRGGRITGGVAAGVEGHDSGGVVWPEAVAGSDWDVTDLVVHNNQEHGSFGWHNSLTRHSIQRLVSYHNPKAGIFHGAYTNPYLFIDCISHANGTGVEWHANSDNNAEVLQEWERLLCDGNWVAHKHTGGGEQRTIYRECEFLGKVRFSDRGGLKPSVIDFIDCTYRGRALQEGDLDLADAHPGNRIVVRNDQRAATSRLSDLPTLPLPQVTEIKAS